MDSDSGVLTLLILLVPFTVLENIKAKGNAILQASLERRKQALQECRSALEQDVYNKRSTFSFAFYWKVLHA
uniref:Uncharacterized protein n=1 Tax=Vitis vinifera TaxID=29760 RepID=F6GZ53_VITVI